MLRLNLPTFLVTIKKAIILFFQCVLMKCFALVMWGEKGLLPNNVCPRKNPLSEIKEQANVFYFVLVFFFISLVLLVVTIIMR